MAERLAPGDSTSCIHFVAAGVWTLGAIGDRAADSSGSVRWWQRRRVGNRRYGGAEEGHALGRRRCAIRFSARQDRQLQTLVSLTLARGEVPVMVALRLFLPDSWVNDRRRLKRAGVPAGYRTSRTKLARPLRGTVMARSSSSCSLMAMSFAFLQHRRLKDGRRGKKSTARHLNRRCRRFATPSSTSSCDQVLSDVRTADPGSARKSSVSKSAKVVLAPRSRRVTRAGKPCIGARYAFAKPFALGL